MKRSLIIIPVIILLLLLSCFDPPEPPEENSWLETLIANAEADTDSTFAQAIWSYEYHDEIVFYVSEFYGWGFNRVYDSSGTFLGAPDGGWRNQGDGLLPGFLDSATNRTLVWTYDFPEIAAANEEYQIINAVLRSRFRGADYLHLTGCTFAYTDFFSYQYRLDEGGIVYDSLMLDDFILNNETPLCMCDSFLIDIAVTVDRSELDSIWMNYQYPYDWQEYYSRYPESNGIIEVSRPGLSPDGQMAVMKLGYQYSGDGGNGYLAILIKVNGQWIVRWWFDTWIS